MVRWGMIGAGDVTEVKSGPAFNKVADSKLLMVMRRNPDKLRDYAERHQVPHYTTNADDVFNNPGIDAVYIATPPASHAGYTIRAANAGKHVYVEKPMAASIRQRIALRHHLPLRGYSRNRPLVFQRGFRRTDRPDADHGS